MDAVADQFSAAHLMIRSARLEPTKLTKVSLYQIFRACFAGATVPKVNFRRDLKV